MEYKVHRPGPSSGSMKSVDDDDFSYLVDMYCKEIDKQVEDTKTRLYLWQISVLADTYTTKSLLDKTSERFLKAADSIDSSDPDASSKLAEMIYDLAHQL